MEISEIVERKMPANRHLEYLPVDAESRKILEELIGMSNGEGGSVVISTRTEKEDSLLENVTSRVDIVKGIRDALDKRVEPYLGYRSDLFEINGIPMLAFTVPPSDIPRSYRHPGDEKPVFPIRRERRLEYMSGQDIARYITGHQTASQSKSRT